MLEKKSKQQKSKKKQHNLPTVKEIVSNEFTLKNFEIEGSPLMLLDDENKQQDNLQQNLTLSTTTSIENNLICGNNTYLDENELTIWHMSHKFNYNTKNKKWPTHTKIYCWNDGESFNTTPIMIPRNVDILIEEFSNFEGVFCNIGCALRWLKDQGSTDIPMRVMKFGIFISKVLNLDLKEMRVAYPKIMLKKFGGNLTIERYRQDYNLYEQDISQIDHIFLPAVLLFEIDRKIKNSSSSEIYNRHAQIYDFEEDLYKNTKDEKICIFNTPLWVLKNDHKKMDFDENISSKKIEEEEEEEDEEENYYNNDDNDDELLYDFKKK